MYRCAITGIVCFFIILKIKLGEVEFSIFLLVLFNEVNNA